MKKFLSTLLVLAMVLSMAACGGGSGTSTPTSTPAAGSSGGSASSAVEGESDRSEKMKISVALWDAETVDDKVGQFVQDKLNVEFDLQPLSWDNPEQVSLFGATDSLPDVTGSYPTNEMSMFYSWIEQGIIRDIPYEMIEKYPYIKEIVDNDVVLNAVKEVQGGKYWYLPRPESFENIYQATTTGIYYRKDWLENVGIEKAPETVDEFYEMLVAFKEKDPDGNGKNDTVPLSMQKFVSDTTPDLLFGFWGLADPMSWYKTDDGTWQPGYFTDAMLEPLKFYRKLYQEGLIDPEFTTVSRDQMIQLLCTGKAGCIVRNADADWVNKVVNRSFHTANPDLDALETIGLLSPLSAKEGEEPTVAPFPSLSGSYISSKVDDAKLDRILDWMNWTLSPEGRDLYRYGIEGESYKRDGDKVELIMDPATGEAYKYESNPLGLIATWDYDFAADPDAVNDFMPGIKEMAAEYRLKMNECVQYNDDGLIAKMISTPAKDELQIAVGDKFMQIIIGTEDVETMFRAFQDECRNLGMDDAIQEVTAEMAKRGK
ncbi:extracellular solute-binding protein [Subdoligranulum sp. AM23-21AC]|mgnify:FL=1|uniref:extracellular solute-binding protein n=1 Tax=Ruthenibacterium lactatiformans TaxID=1550024 RepID=UPI000E3F3F1F|nr:extracellular solute-binding protein [Subdoligranulum sp. AM23-21AC]